MTSKYAIAVNGLDKWLFGGPLTQLATFLNDNTPAGTHFEVVGGTDPRPCLDQFVHNLAAACGAGYVPLLVGHSLGAMMMFYLADAMKAKGFKLPLVVSIDSTDWGTNAPGAVAYALGQPTAGQYYVPDNVDRGYTIASLFIRAGASCNWRPATRIRSSRISSAPRLTLCFRCCRMWRSIFCKLFWPYREFCREFRREFSENCRNSRARFGASRC